MYGEHRIHARVLPNTDKWEVKVQRTQLQKLWRWTAEYTKMRLVKRYPAAYDRHCLSVMKIWRIYRCSHPNEIDRNHSNAWKVRILQQNKGLPLPQLCRESKEYDSEVLPSTYKNKIPSVTSFTTVRNKTHDHGSNMIQWWLMKGFTTWCHYIGCGRAF